MPIRMTGLISNLDTEGIIKELMGAQNLKKTKVENKITKLEWKQEKWKELNTKIYKLYTDSLADMKTEGTYLTKKASSSNEGKLKVSAGSSAAEGTHSVTVGKLASAQYLTGGVIKPPMGSGLTEVNRATKLADLGFDTSGSSVIKIQTGASEIATELVVDEETTIADFVEKCKEAGINASFDDTYDRIFLSAKASGVENAFSITTGVSSAGDEREALKDVFDFDNLSSGQKAKVNTLIDNLRTASLGDDGNAMTEAEEALSDYLTTLQTDKIKKETEEAYRASLAKEEDFSQEALDTKIGEALAAAETQMTEKATALGTAIGNYETAVEDETLSAAADGGLKNLGLADVNYTVDANGEINYSELDASAGASLVKAADGWITYNGAKFEASSNSYTINGLNFTANAVTVEGEAITVTVNKDVDAVYDKVKNFIKQYNELLEEMNKLYDADSAKGYDILTDEEREAMTEEQIEKWENKIKDSLLRRDDSLGSLLNTMKTTLSKSVTVNGKSYALSSFGIVTSDYKEKGKLHLLGDGEDTYGKDFEDKLKAALSEDADTVMQVLSGVTKELYDNMNEKMKTSTVSSALTFYNDKQLDKTMKTYKDDLATLEDRLKEIEDRYYAQFTRMEVAMSKMNSQQSSLGSFMGGGM